MCRFLVFTSLVTLVFPAFAGADPSQLPDFPSPSGEPLGLLVGKSKTIHVLETTEIDGPQGVSFKTTAALKGKAEEVPFRSLMLGSEHGTVGGKGYPFQKGDTVLCFFLADQLAQGDRGGVAVLHVGDCWGLAVRPSSTPGHLSDWSHLRNGIADLNKPTQVPEWPCVSTSRPFWPGVRRPSPRGNPGPGTLLEAPVCGASRPGRT